MPMFIELTDDDGGATVYINPVYIVGLRAAVRTIVFLAEGSPIVVRERCEDVLKLLNEWRIDNANHPTR